MDCSPPGSSVHGIFQARIVEWVAIPFSRGSSWPRDQTWISHFVGRFFTIWATREAQPSFLLVFYFYLLHMVCSNNQNSRMIISQGFWEISSVRWLFICISSSNFSPKLHINILTFWTSMYYKQIKFNMFFSVLILISSLLPPIYDTFIYMYMETTYSNWLMWLQRPKNSTISCLQVEKQESQWCKSVWLWRPENQDCWSLRAGEDGCLA